MGFLDFIPIVGDVIQGASNVISTSMTNKAARRNQREAQEWNEKMNLQNQQWEEKMWNMNNEYNSPAQQMQRLEDAGINPNSQFGGMSQNATSQMPQQPVVPTLNGAPVAPFDFGLSKLGDHLLQAELLDAQKKNIEADTEGKLAAAGTEEAQQKLIEQQVESFKISNEWTPKEKEAYINSVNKSVDKMSSEMDLNDSQRRQINYMVDNILPLQKDLTLAEISKAGAAIKEMLAQASAAYAQASKAKAEAGLAGAQTEMVKEQTKGIQIDNETRGILNRLSALHSVRDIEGLELSNSEREYFVKQLKTFGFNVSESDMEPLIKAVLLSQLGDADAIEAANKKLGTLPNMLNTTDTDKMFDIVLNMIGSVASGYIGGKAAGAGVGRGIKDARPSAPTFAVPRNSFQGGHWFSSSPSTLNPY